MKVDAGPLLISVTVEYSWHDGKWIARTKETGVIATGLTRGDARRRARKWNTKFLTYIAQNGKPLTEQYLDRRGIPFEWLA